MVQLSYLYMTTEKTIAFTTWIFVSKVISLLLNMLSMFVIAFLHVYSHTHTHTHTHIYRERESKEKHRYSSKQSIIIS